MKTLAKDYLAKEYNLSRRVYILFLSSMVNMFLSLSSILVFVFLLTSVSHSYFHVLY